MNGHGSRVMFISAGHQSHCLAGKNFKHVKDYKNLLLWEVRFVNRAR